MSVSVCSYRHVNNASGSTRTQIAPEQKERERETERERAQKMRICKAVGIINAIITHVHCYFSECVKPLYFYASFSRRFLWSPYVIGQTIIFAL